MLGIGTKIGTLSKLQVKNKKRKNTYAQKKIIHTVQCTIYMIMN